MAEPRDEELEAELASILRRSPDDLVHRDFESLVRDCEVMTLYTRALLPKNGMACEPRKCDECGELFTPPLDPGALLLYGVRSEGGNEARARRSGAHGRVPPALLSGSLNLKQVEQVPSPAA